jgi:DNA polymerase V
MKNIRLHTSGRLDIYPASYGVRVELPLAQGGIVAGFPSPAQDFLDHSIDLNAYLVKNREATFYGRVKGDSMINAGIADGDLLVIDKSVEPENGKIAVCYVEGEFTVKRIKIQDNRCWLMPENDDFQPIEVLPDNQFMIWGIVLHVIKSF